MPRGSGWFGLHAAQGLAERAPRVREMAVRPVDVDGRDKPDHDGEGRGFHPPRLIHRGNAGAALAVTEEWGEGFVSRPAPGGWPLPCLIGPLTLLDRIQREFS
jgi:hypothetical protein